MKDHTPTQILPNGAIRYGIYNDNGTLNRYEYIKLEDEPTEVGSAINKANFLPDTVTAALSLPGTDPQVKDALLKLAYKGFAFALTVKFSNGNVAANVKIGGLTSPSGGDCITDANGFAIGVSSTASVTISITDYIDIEPYSSTLTATSGLTNIGIQLTNKTTNFMAITTSKNIMFSRNMNVNIHLIGGGSNGNSGDGNYGGAGGYAGDSGYSYYVTNVAVTANTVYPAVVGSVNGGQSTLLGKTSASGTRTNGGYGGTNSSAGGNGSGGGVSPIDNSLTYGGSGGGGQGGSSGSYGTGAGSNGGGNGGGRGYEYGKGGNGTDATAYGGGGGGGGGNGAGYQGSGAGGAGKQGAIYIKWGV